MTLIGHYFKLREGTPAEGQDDYRSPAGDYIIIDLDEEGRILGVEVLLKEEDETTEEIDEDEAHT